MRAILISILILIAGCSIFENEQSVPGQFTGEWEWYLTVGGFGHSISVDSVDYSMRLRIYTQNEAKWFRNETLIDKYFIQKGEEHWTKGKWVMHSIKHKKSCGFALNYDSRSNELQVPSADCTDMPTHYFRKAVN